MKKGIAIEEHILRKTNRLIFDRFSLFSFILKGEKVEQNTDRIFSEEFFYFLKQAQQNREGKQKKVNSEIERRKRNRGKGGELFFGIHY